MTDQLALQHAQQLLEADRADLALPVLRSLLSDQPAQPDALVLLSRALSDLEQNQAALDAARGALALVPDDHGALLALSTAQLNLKHYPESRASALAALRRAPDDFWSHYQVALIDTQREVASPEGRAAIEALVHLAPNASESHLMRGSYALLLDNDRSTAEAALMESLRLDPQNPHAKRLLALTRITRGRALSATADLIDGVRAQPDSALALFSLRLAIAGSLAWIHIAYIAALALLSSAIGRFVFGYTFTANLTDGFPPVTARVAVAAVAACVTLVFVIRLRQKLGSRLSRLVVTLPRFDRRDTLWVLLLATVLAFFVGAIWLPAAIVALLGRLMLYALLIFGVIQAVLTRGEARALDA